MSHFPFRRVQSELAEMINSLPAETRLPSEPTLAKQMGVSRATLREAMRSFEGQGMIRRRQGVGTFVVAKVPVLDTGLEALESIETIAQRSGLTVRMGELQVQQVAADEGLAAVLNLKVGADLTRVARIIFTDQRPIAYLVDTLPMDILAVDELQSGFTGSVLDLLLRRGDPKLIQSRTEIKAIGATSEVARALQIQREDVLLQFAAQLYSEDSRVVDYSISYFLPGYFRFHVVRRVG
ncbi:MAG: GntR family transcriptional regulator [Anaerolineales bacterium]|nr:GntR family transcriptional regulator [Anaerolineales bacterium]